MLSVRSDLLTRFTSAYLTYLLVILLCAPFSTFASPSAANSNLPARSIAAASQQNVARRSGELLVKFRGGVSARDRDAVINSHRMRRKKKLRGASGVEKLEVLGQQDADTVALQLRLNPRVEFVEPNFLIAKDELVPDDPNFSEQWALRNTGQSGGQFGSDIGAATAWQSTTGAQSTIIAVIDSGIDFTHPDLINNRWENAAETANGTDDDGNGLVDDVNGWDYIAGSGAVRDEQGHGTAVAGIIAGQGNNSIGGAGVMWRAGLMSLRVLDNTGTGDVADAVEAIDYAVAHGAQVINCSWGTDGESLILRDAIQRAGASGVVVVSSAGNSGRDIDSAPYYPASFGLSNQIAVAATDNFDHLTSSSNYGSTHVTIAAPGAAILTTKMGGDYTTLTGTSASAPLVAGVAGLIKTQRWWLSAAGTRAAIVDGARSVAELTAKVSSGGVVSASGALAALQEPGPEPSPTPSPGGNGGGGSSQTDPDTPGPNLPDLDAERDRVPAAPVAPAPIRSDNLCLDCGDPGGGAGGSDPYFGTARTRRENETGSTGVNLGSRNFNWSLPLVSLPGRSGLDLNIGISYNSLVWTKQGNSIMFNSDRGNPTAGFRLGLPTLQAKYVNEDTTASAYMLLMPSGQRVELRQVGATTTYEAQDGSYMQAIDTGGTGTNVVAKTTDGTQYVFNYPTGAYGLYCTQVKDRNGNYITINYNANGEVGNIVDTLLRTVTFNYNVDNQISSITQTWNGATHTWATFGYGTLAISTNFPGLSYLGPAGSITVLTQIGLADGTRYNFDYTSWGQVYKIRHYAQDNHQLSYTSYNLPLDNAAAETDCPRFTERRDWAQNWNGDTNGVPVTTEEAITAYAVAADNSWSKVTAPDGSIYKEFFATTGWQKGLTTSTKSYANATDELSDTAKKWTTVSWTQDDTTLTYPKNPRPTEMNINDEAGNHRRTTISYYPTTSFSLPSDVYEYAANATTVLRRSHIDYNLTTIYLNHRVIGLPSMKIVYDGASNIVSKVEYQYDEAGIYFADQGAATSHDTALYGNTFRAGRGNLTSVRRWDADYPTDGTKVVESNAGYNTAGSVILTRDPRAQQTTIFYDDTFSDATKNSLHTLAYPTKVTDPDSYEETAEYNYDMSAVTKSSSPSSGTGTGITYEDLTYTYDTAGRPTRVTNLENNAYTRWVYPTSNTLLQQYQTINTTLEAYTTQLLDGAGRVRGASSDHPGSTGLYSGQYYYYDVMGRLWKQSNPTEMTGAWAAAGDDSSAGWKYTLQTYDWKGRPLVTTNTDNTTRTNTYGGCGCAGGEQVTAGDERGRQKTMTKDVLGRLVKVEERNFDASVYATTNYTYDTLDQLTQIDQAGQLRTFDYDGHGRLSSRATPEQGTTTYTYNTDDTLLKITDARGATTSFVYNNRHLPTSITYGLAAGVAATPNVTLVYDAAGNRTSMVEKIGAVTVGSSAYHYDSLARMDWEERTIPAVDTYRLTYAYNLSGELTNLTGPSQFGSIGVGYTYDKTGRPSTVTGANYGGVSSYASNIKYRAWSGLRSMSYGDGKALSTTYDTRMRATKWDVPGVMGWNYAYNYFNENTGRVTYAQNLYDATLDRSYDYDNVGRLIEAHTGSEARGALVGQGGAQDGPYSHSYRYDPQGNMWYRVGWGGSFNPWLEQWPQFTNNRLTTNPWTGAAMTYDASGNLTNDGYQTYTYDAMGQQATASAGALTQSYDGDGLRVKKIESGVTTYYLRSSVLGGQVFNEIDQSGGLGRGYVYLGGQMLAIQNGGSVNWVHQDPVTKSQRITNSSGAVTSTIDLDPWGGETSRSSNQAFQPHRYTTYERDANGGDEAMMRRYTAKWHRFDQPDPYDGSYSLTNPQSFNRYPYVQNDPANFIDPTGLVTYDGAPGGDPTKVEAGGFFGALFGGGSSIFTTLFHTQTSDLIGGVRTYYPERTYISTWLFFGSFGVGAGRGGGGGSGGGGFGQHMGRGAQPQKPTPATGYTCSTISGATMTVGGIVDSNSQVHPTIGIEFSLPRSFYGVSYSQTQSSGPVRPGVYLYGTASSGLTITHSVNMGDLLNGQLTLQRAVGGGTPSVGVGVQVVLPALQGTTPYDWAHHRDNPLAKHKFLSPVGRCVD